MLTNLFDQIEQCSIDLVEATKVAAHNTTENKITDLRTTISQIRDRLDEISEDLFDESLELIDE